MDSCCPLALPPPHKDHYITAVMVVQNVCLPQTKRKKRTLKLTLSSLNSGKSGDSAKQYNIVFNKYHKCIETLNGGGFISCFLDFDDVL